MAYRPKKQQIHKTKTKIHRNIETKIVTQFRCWTQNSARRSGWRIATTSCAASPLVEVDGRLQLHFACRWICTGFDFTLLISNRFQCYSSRKAWSENTKRLTDSAMWMVDYGTLKVSNPPNKNFKTKNTSSTSLSPLVKLKIYSFLNPQKSFPPKPTE